MELGMPNSGEALEIVLYLNLIRENVSLSQAFVVDPPQSSCRGEQRWPIDACQPHPGGNKIMRIIFTKYAFSTRRSACLRHSTNCQ